MATQTLTITEFKVDLQQLDEAIQAVTRQADAIALHASTIGSLLQGVAADWASPAEIPFDDLQRACTKQLGSLTDLLQNMIVRMRTAYQNYLDAEQANVANMK